MNLTRARASEGLAISPVHGEPTCEQRKEKSEIEIRKAA